MKKSMALELFNPPPDGTHLSSRRIGPSQYGGGDHEKIRGGRFSLRDPRPKKEEWFWFPFQEKTCTN